LALDRINSESAALSDYAELANLSKDHLSDNLHLDLTTLVIQTNFLSLKVNFEFFLNRLVFSIWDCHFNTLIRKRKVRVLSKTHRLAEFASAVVIGRAKEYVLSRVVPTHGLDQMASAIEETTGMSCARLLNEANHKLWSQIDSAFQVRHLIEHTNATIDDGFMADIAPKPSWQNSSWRDVPVAVGSKIKVRLTDFDLTFQTMDAATDVIAPALAGYAP
jgi:hypothetical protein